MTSVNHDTDKNVRSNSRLNTMKIIENLEIHWELLCNLYLPVHEDNTIWRQNRVVTSSYPNQGWKLHISATLLSACDVFEKVAHFLCNTGILFKAPKSLLELKRINCGLFYGYSQIGKCVTIYPRTNEEAFKVAYELDKLTNSFSGPLVPYDIPLREGSLVHYRYGSFINTELLDSNNKKVPAILDPKGEFVEDDREKAVPDWVCDSNPFTKNITPEESKTISLSMLSTTVLVYEAISQRGKGGVYRSLDLSLSPGRLCILKEGRRYGEVDWDKRDGFDRVKHEEYVLNCLNTADIPVPKVYNAFTEGSNYYLAMEYIEGRNLQSLSLKKLPITDALRYGIQIAKLLDSIHTAGWVWRDCKPLNLILSEEGEMRPLDFEGSCTIDLPDEMQWGTAGYIPPEWNKEFSGQSRLPEDLYALGATLHQLFCGRIPLNSPLPPIGKLRRNVPLPVRNIISSLLDFNPEARPSARIVLKTLEVSLEDLLVTKNIG